MKKLMLFSLVVALFAACQSPVSETVQDEKLMLKGAEKVDVCHWDEDAGTYVFISIAEPAWYNGHGEHINDKEAYSPEGHYTIYRENGAVLEVDIVSNGVGGYDVSGDGLTKAPYEVYFEGATIDVDEDNNTFILTLPQYLKDGDSSKGTHYISGDILQCGGIDNLTDDANNSDYSLTPW